MSAGQILQGANTVLIVNPFMNFGSNIITANLVARWAGTDGSGTTLTDSVAGRNGTLTNGPTWAAGPVAGTGAVVCDGVNDRVTVANNSALQPYPFTLTMWVKTVNATAWAGIIMKAVPGSENGFALFFRTAPGVQFYYYRASGSSASKEFSPTPAINNNSWRHLAFTVGSSGLIGYCDGSNINSASWTGTAGAPTSTASLVMGAYSDASNPCACSLADVRIYSAALSAANIALIAAGNG